MTAVIQQFLTLYDGLPESERAEASQMILQHILRDVPVEIPEDCLAQLADELFQEMDAREEADGRS